MSENIERQAATFAIRRLDQRKVIFCGNAPAPLPRGDSLIAQTKIRREIGHLGPNVKNMRHAYYYALRIFLGQCAMHIFIL
ncbi:hypothetical protein [Paracoccus aminophilus]|uniref:hypothetical protein n=1 Tax=Paracoccus aminophilus TaxID=34003 RepID=UPI0011DD4E0C|nr:hypothetical protein [Paracoccus aminophilus]